MTNHSHKEINQYFYNQDRKITKKLEKLSSKIKKAEKNNDYQKIDNLIKEFNNLSQKALRTADKREVAKVFKGILDDNEKGIPYEHTEERKKAIDLAIKLLEEDL